tara:strand:+ start:176 stop:688 length:513 start_codon:yes stop_codon:yes gene_type:complete
MGPLQHYIGLWDNSKIARSDNKEWIIRMNFLNNIREKLGFMTLNEIDIFYHLAREVISPHKYRAKVGKDNFDRFIEKYIGMKLLYTEPVLIEDKKLGIGNGHLTLISKEVFDILKESDVKRCSDAYTEILREFEILKVELKRIILYQENEELEENYLYEVKGETWSTENE